MSYLTNTQKATYALLADNVYWDVRKGFTEIGGQDDFSNSNWTPVPEGWTVIYEVSGSGQTGRVENPELQGFSARVFQDKISGEIVIAYAGTDDSDVDKMAMALKATTSIGSSNIKSGDMLNDVQMGLGGASEQANQAALLYQKIKHENPTADIKFTGHSLGGGLAAIMGVVFDEPAIVFDHAPFKRAVTDRIPLDLPTGILHGFVQNLKGFSSTLKGIYNALHEQKNENIKAMNEDGTLDLYTVLSLDFMKYYTLIDNFDSRVSNVDATAVKGEFLSHGTYDLRIENTYIKNIGKALGINDVSLMTKNEYLLDGESNRGYLGKDQMMTRHSQSLLVASLLSDNLENYGTLKNGNNANIDTINFMVDSNLYAFSPKETRQNFLTKLVRNEVGGKDFLTGDQTGTSIKYAKNGMLDHFGNDLANIAVFLNAHQGKYTKAGYDALITQTIEWYYHQDSETYKNKGDEADKQFFHLSENLIQYTTAQGEDPTNENRVKDYTQKWVNEVFATIDEASLRPDTNLDYGQWNITFGDTPSEVRDNDQSQILLALGDEGSHFTSGEKDDLLIGNKGDDTIVGGLGNDTIYGGQGNDTLTDNGSGETLDLIQFKDNDTLYGGAGNDTLIAGTGNDTLLGGDDFDIYDIRYTAVYGEDTYGFDTIFDSDGEGKLLMQDREPTVAYRISENMYTSADGVFTFQLVPIDNPANLNEDLDAYNLIITEQGIYGHVKIENWFEGDLGINIDGLPESPDTGFYQQSVDVAHPPQTFKPVDNGNDKFYATEILPVVKDRFILLDTKSGDDLISLGGQDAPMIISAGNGSDTIITGNGNDQVYVDGYRPEGYGTWAPSATINNKGGWTVNNDDVMTEGVVDLIPVLPHDQDNRITIDWVNRAITGKGDDHIEGHYGNEYIDAGDGNDEVYGGGNSDFISSGAGNDLIHGDGIVVKQFLDKSDYVYSNSSLDDSYDTLNKDALFDNYHEIHTGGYKVHIWPSNYANFGYHADDSIDAGAGDDIVYGEGGNDTIYGGTGNDIIAGDNIKSVSLTYEPHVNKYITEEDAVNEFDNEEDGIAYVNYLHTQAAQSSGNDSIYGGGGDDKIFGGSKADYIEGNEGNDTIFADSDIQGTNQSPGGFVLKYEQGLSASYTYSKDTIWGNDIVYGGTGNDTVWGEGGDDYIYGEDGDDNLYGDILIGDEETNTEVLNFHGVDHLFGGKGKDSLHGLGGDDTIDGGDDDDVIIGDGIQSQIAGEFHGNDSILAGQGNDSVYGSGGDDIINGEDGDDTLYGDMKQSNLDGKWHGKDTINGGAGEDTIYGQGGNDTIYGDDDDDYIQGDGNESAISGQWHGDDLIYAGSGDDIVFGDGGKDTIYGGEGDDVINGDETTLNTMYHDDDTLYGQAGNDEIAGYGGDDTIFGGIGDDIISGEGLGIDASAHGRDKLYGGAGNDTIYGDGNDDIIFGDSGNDIIYADDAKFSDRLGNVTGNDKAYGGQGVDKIYGGRGNDELYGNEGDDFLIAGLGKDYLYGGEGTDGYIFSKAILQDGKTNYIQDSDNTGQILIDDYNLAHDSDWYITDNDNPNYVQTWTDEQGRFIHRVNDGYLITLEDTSSQIKIITGLSPEESPLGFYLHGINGGPNFNTPPVVNTPVNDITVMPNQEFVTTFPDYLFTDPEGDALKYLVILADGNNLPEYLNFDIATKTLSGALPIDVTLELKIVAVDPVGNRASQTFKVGSAQEFELLQPLEDELYLGSKDTDWEYRIPEGTFNHAGALNYALLMADGSQVPNGISIDPSTGEIKADGSQLNVNDNILTSYNIIIEVTDDSWGTTLTMPVKLTVGNGSLIIADDAVTQGTHNNDLIVVIDDNSHSIDALDGDDVIKGGANNDDLNGGQGADTLYGGMGDDTYYIDNIQDQAIEEVDAGNDTVISTIDYTLGANIENLSLIEDALAGNGNELDNTIIGNDLDNILDGRAGADQLQGGLGNDTYYIDTIADHIIEGVDAGNDTVMTTIDYVLSANLENLTLLNVAQSGTGNDLNNRLVGNDLDNTLVGMAGDDTLVATIGADVLNGGAGQDTYEFNSRSLNDGLMKTIIDSDLQGRVKIDGQILGGNNQAWQLVATSIDTGYRTWTDGNDNYIVQGDQGYTITNRDFDSSILIVTDDFETTSILGIELMQPTTIEATNSYAWGTLSDDIIIANDGKEHNINAFLGNDTIKGGNQTDVINGGIGNDLIFGMDGDDTLYGSTGDDLLTGGHGDDILKGGSGDDTYLFNRGDDNDTIQDWTGNDTLDITDFALSDLTVSQEDSSLILKFGNTDESGITTQSQDSITIEGWNLDGYHIENIELANTILTAEQLTNMIG